MDFIYLPGDIVYFKNVIFTDPDGQQHVDTRIAGHPFLILNEVKELGDKCYALKITSRKLANTKQFHLDKKSTVPWLRKESYINLDKVFEFNVEKVIVRCCYLKPKTINKVLQMI